MFDKQIEAFEKFSQLKVGALFMQMGTGKTKVAVDLVNFNNVDLLIYIAPFSTLDNIKIELEKWKLNCEFILSGYETIQSSTKKYLDLLMKVENKRCFIIADESIFIKNEDTKRYLRLSQIRKSCEYALILNGTPLTKNEWDLYNQMEFLSPLILKMNRNEFNNTFFKRITYKKRFQKEHTFYKFSEVNAAQLYKLINPYIFNAELDLNIKQKDVTTYVEYESDEYDNEKLERLSQMKEDGISSMSIISMLTSLNVIASNYDEKNKAVAEYVSEKQVIVYCTFLKELESIKKKCDCFVITGETKNRNDIINEFKNNSKPLLMTFGVGSYSLNLQFCNEIVYSSLNFDFGKIEQSKYRIKRIGQERDVKYTYFLTNLGINRLILNNIEKKSNLKQLIEEKIKGGDYEWLKSI